MDPEILNALILGVLQGLTEFLPVSSSGHLEIGKVILGSNLQGDESLLMTVVLHAATAFSTIAVFYRDIARILAGLAQFTWNEDFQFSLKVVISMIPAVAVGLTMEDTIEGLFNGNMLLVGACLLCTGLLLFLADRADKTDKQVGYFEAAIIGVSQAIAILPGISRSGATISTSVLLGVDRMEAARFSFLMVIPLILGKMAKDLLSGDLVSNATQITPLAVGFLAAFITGVLACKWMISLVKNFQLWLFSIYCFLIGAIAMTYALMPNTTAAATSMSL